MRAIAGKGKQKVRADDSSVVMHMPPARTCGAESTSDNRFLNSQRSARQSPQMQHDLTQKVRSKDLGKNTKLLNDRLALETRFSNGGLTQLSMTRPRSPTETMMVV